MDYHGTQKYFSDQEQLTEEASYEYGRLHGERKLYDSELGLYRHEFYKNGVLQSASDYNRYGQVIRETQFHPDGSVKNVKEKLPGV